MTGEIEMEIRRRLLDSELEADIFAALAYRLHDLQLANSEKRALMMFAYNTGQIPELCKAIAGLARARRYLPLELLTEIVCLQGTKPDQELIDSIYQACQELRLQDSIIVNTKWDRVDSRTTQTRQTFIKQKNEQQKIEKRTLIDRLTFFRNEKLIEDEHNTLALLAKIWPSDLEIKDLNEKFKERWARHIIAKHQLGGDDSADYIVEITDPKEKLFLEFVTTYLTELAKNKSTYAYDFAVLLASFDYPQGALKVLAEAPERLDRDWFNAELLLRSKLSIECLEYLLILENRYGDDPETAFSVTYMRAQALWQLGQNSAAIELLKTLVQIRPNYRSAASFLDDWTERS